MGNKILTICLILISYLVVSAILAFGISFFKRKIMKCKLKFYTEKGLLTYLVNVPVIAMISALFMNIYCGALLLITPMAIMMRAVSSESGDEMFNRFLRDISFPSFFFFSIAGGIVAWVLGIIREFTKTEKS